MDDGAVTDGGEVIEAMAPNGAGCAHTFCDDFDHAALGALWDAPQTSGALALDGAESMSPPNSLRIRYGDGRVASMRKSFAGASRVRLAFDVRLDAAPPGAVAVATVSASGGDAYVTLEYRPSGNLQLQICVQSGCMTTQDVGALATDRFRHVLLDGDRRGGGVGVTLDGVQVIVGAGPIPGQSVTAIIYEVGDGIPATGPNGGTIHVDNMVVDAT
jgi:hypothetical protein